MGQFLYYSHPSTCEMWTLVRHLLVHISHFRDNLVFFFAAIKFGGWKKCLGSKKKSIYLFLILGKNTMSLGLPQLPDSFEVYVAPHLSSKRPYIVVRNLGGNSFGANSVIFVCPKNKCSSFSQLQFIETETGNSACRQKVETLPQQSERM